MDKVEVNWEKNLHHIDVGMVLSSLLCVIITHITMWRLLTFDSSLLTHIIVVVFNNLSVYLSLFYNISPTYHYSITYISIISILLYIYVYFFQFIYHHYCTILILIINVTKYVYVYTHCL